MTQTFSSLLNKTVLIEHSMLSYDFYIREPFIANWVVILFVSIITLVAVLRTMGEKYLVSLTQSVFNNQTAIRLHREQLTSNRFIVFLIEILYYLSLSSFLYHILKVFVNKLPATDFRLYLFVLVLTVAFVNVKRFVYGIISAVFEGQNETGEFLFYKRLSNHIVGLFLLIPAFSMFFVSGILFNVLSIFGVFIIAIPSIIAILRGGAIILKKGFFVFYLILYLCTLEILPLLIVWKILW